MNEKLTVTCFAALGSYMFDKNWQSLLDDSYMSDFAKTDSYMSKIVRMTVTCQILQNRQLHVEFWQNVTNVKIATAKTIPINQ
jgi:hypothetical protein